MVTVGSNWSPPENYFDQDDGVYPVTLVRIGITDKDGTFVPGGRRVFESSMYGARDVQDWTFALEGGQVIESMVTAPRVAKDGSEVISPKSTYYAYITALSGGKAIAEGTEFDPQKHLLGREALATIQRSDGGFPRIANLGAMPTTKAKPAPGAAPVEAVPATAPAPLREAVAAGGDALPF